MTQEAIRRQIEAIQKVTAEFAASPEKALAFLVAAGIVPPNSTPSKTTRKRATVVPATENTTQKKK